MMKSAAGWLTNWAALREGVSGLEAILKADSAREDAEESTFGSEACYHTIFRYVFYGNFGVPFTKEALWLHLAKNGYDMASTTPDKMMDEIYEWGIDDLTADAKKLNYDAKLIELRNGSFRFGREGARAPKAPVKKAIGKRAVTTVVPKSEPVNVVEEIESEDEEVAAKRRILATLQGFLEQGPQKLSAIKRYLGDTHQIDEDQVQGMLEEFVQNDVVYTYRDTARCYTLDREFAVRENERAAARRQAAKQQEVIVDASEDERRLDAELGASILEVFLRPNTKWQQRKSPEEVLRVMERSANLGWTAGDINSTARQLARLNLMVVGQASQASGANKARNSKSRGMSVFKIGLSSQEVKDLLKATPDLVAFLKQL